MDPTIDTAITNLQTRQLLVDASGHLRLRAQGLPTAEVDRRPPSASRVAGMHNRGGSGGTRRVRSSPLHARLPESCEEAPGGVALDSAPRTGMPTEGTLLPNSNPYAKFVHGDQGRLAGSTFQRRSLSCLRSPREDSLQPSRRITKHGRQHMLIAHGHADLAVAKKFHRRADRRTRGQ